MSANKTRVWGRERGGVMTNECEHKQMACGENEFAYEFIVTLPSPACLSSSHQFVITRPLALALSRGVSQLVAGLAEPFPPSRGGVSRVAATTTATARAAVAVAEADGGATDSAESGGGAPCFYMPGPTPSCLRSSYGASNYTAASADAGGRMAVAEFAGSYYKASDLAAFQKRYLAPQQPVNEVQGRLPAVVALAGIEASLDIEVIMGVGQDIATVYTQIDDATATPFLDWALLEVGGRTFSVGARSAGRGRSVKWESQVVFKVGIMPFKVK